MSFNNFFNDPFFSNSNSFFSDPFANDPFFNPALRQGGNSNRRIGNGNNMQNNNNNNQLAGFFGGGNDLMNFGNFHQGLGFDDHFFGGGGGGNGGAPGSQINVETRPDHYKLTLEIYNLDQTSVDLHVDPVGKSVSVAGSVTKEVNQNGFRSVSQQSFQQSVGLPSLKNEIIDDSNVKVDYTNNVLTIRVPRTSLKQLQQNEYDESEAGDSNVDKFIEDKDYVADSNKIEEV